MSLDDLEAQLCLARSACRKAKKDHVALREAFWDTFDPKVRDWLKRHEQAQNLGRMAPVINGKLDSLQVKAVEHEGSLCDTKERIKEVRLPVNKAKSAFLRGH